MGLAVKVKLKDGEKVLKDLRERGFLDSDYKIEEEKGFLFIPVEERVKKYKVVERKLKKIKKEKTVAEMLKNKLSEEKLNLLPRTFEEIGDILVLELPEKLKKKRKMIGEAFLKRYGQIKTVLMKKEEHTGEFRLRKLEWLAGEKKKETWYKENGVELKVHLEKAYFSTKLAGERLRIAELAMPGEEVLVMFSGVGVYPLVIARNSKAKEVVGVELNPYAHKLGEENVKKNKFWGKVKLYQGDARKVVPELGRKFDKVVMPLPKTGEQFLHVALDAVKKNGFIHYYAFLGEEFFESEAEKIKKICKENGKRCKIWQWQKCGSFAPGVFRIVYDVQVR